MGGCDSVVSGGSGCGDDGCGGGGIGVDGGGGGVDGERTTAFSIGSSYNFCSLTKKTRQHFGKCTGLCLVTIVL